MPKTFILILFIALNLLVTNISAKAEDTSTPQDPPKGMEITNVGPAGQQLILPKGTKMHKVGAQLLIEDNAQYIATRIWNLEKRMKELELTNEEIKKQLEELKKSLPKAS